MGMVARGQWESGKDMGASGSDRWLLWFFFTDFTIIICAHVFRYVTLFFFFWVVVVVLGFELRASHLLGRFLSLEPCPSPFFAVVIFHIGSHVFHLGLASDHDPPTYTFCIAGITSTHHHTWFVG
jgi:hypothetical protein